MAHRESHISVAHDAFPAAPFSRRPPSPPPTPIVALEQPIEGEFFAMVPSYDKIDPTQVTVRDIEIITQNIPQVAPSYVNEWRYEKRRESQKVLDFLYLGPIGTIRDHSFLRQEGITMVLVAQNAKMMSQKLQSVEKAVAELGIEAAYVDIDGPDKLISTFPSTIRIINNHLLAVHHRQAMAGTNDGQMTVSNGSVRRGKVLVACESGNDRSAAIVAAYIMTVFGQSSNLACQFTNMQRFCTTFTDDIRRKLLSWEDILRARSQVAHLAEKSSHPSKRHIEDTMDLDEEGEAKSEADEDRFIGREAFVPYVDFS